MCLRLTFLSPKVILGLVQTKDRISQPLHGLILFAAHHEEAWSETRVREDVILALHVLRMERAAVSLDTRPLGPDVEIVKRVIHGSIGVIGNVVITFL